MRTLALLILALPCVVYAMDLSVLDVALPRLSSDLHPSGTQLLWIADVYGFMVAGALVTMGSLADRIGHRRLLLIGAAAFAVASVGAALAPTPDALIAARALQGLAGATIAPTTLTLMGSLFADPAQRTHAVGIWIASFTVGGAIGPLVGGAILQVASWPLVFLPAVPVMLLVVALGPRLLPQERVADAAPLDLRSAALALAAVLAAILALKQLVEGSPLVSAVAAPAALVLGVVFVRRQRRLEHPLIELGLFAAPGFSGVLGANLISFAAVFGLELLLSQALQAVLGLTALQAGVTTLPSAAGFFAGSLLTSRLTARWPRERVYVAGLVLGAVGTAIVATTGSVGLAAAITGSTVLSLGLAPVITLSTDLLTAAAPAERQGMAAGISETSSELGGALGIALLGSLGTAIFRAQSGLDTIGTHPTMDAQDAFATALAVVSGTAALALLVAAGLAYRVLATAGKAVPATA